MQPASHQTVELAKGKHSSPEQGVCVMELASMLAGETFTDRPRSVSRSIAAFLRGYNDMLDDDRRRDLYAYAAKVVGTADSEELEKARAQRLLSWSAERWEHRARWSLVARVKQRSARNGSLNHPELAARYAIRSLGKLTDETHAATLELVDELIAMGAPKERWCSEAALPVGSAI